MKALFSAFFLSGLLASAGRPLAGQDFFRMHLGDAIHDHFGASARGLGDLDGDGLGDYAVGATQGGLNDGGYVRVFSGADGSVLLTLEGAAPGDRFGTSLGPLGDLDGDGIPDFLVGAPGADSRGIDAGSVLIFSGRDGLLLRTVIGDYQNDEFGSSVCAAGDLDGDGLPDFIAGAIQPEFRQFGYARVVSGGTGQPIFTFLGEGKNDEFGSTVLGGLDLDGDPAGDLLVAAPREGARAGGVWAFSGADGLLLAHIRGSLDSQLGSELAVPGDADGDGLDDLLLGFPGKSKPWKKRAGEALLISSATKQTLFQVEGTRKKMQVGFSVGAPGDLDGDGVPELLVGIGDAENSGILAGQLRLYSGADGGLLYEFFGFGTDKNFATTLGNPGDLDGDGVPELMAGTPDLDNGSGSHNPFEGAVTLFTYNPRIRVSPPVPGQIGVSNSVTVTGALPRASVVLVLAEDPGVTVFSCASGKARLDVFRARFARFKGANAAGKATFTFTPPPLASGRSLRFQALDQDACRMSNLVFFTFP